jgi:hypothetical protein
MFLPAHPEAQQPEGRFGALLAENFVNSFSQKGSRMSLATWFSSFIQPRRHPTRTATSHRTQLCVEVLEARAVPTTSGLSGGNAIIPRANTDDFANFSIVDRNNPVNVTGAVTGWDIFAGATTNVRLQIFRQTGPTTYVLVGSGPLVTPVPGANTFLLPTPIAVQAGDLIGYYSQGGGVAEYDLDPPFIDSFGDLSGTVLYTDNNSGPGDGTNFVDSTNRHYSIDAFGVPAKVALTGDAMTQDALNLAKQGKLTVTFNNISGLLTGDTLTTFVSTAKYFITVGTNNYEFVPTTVTTSGSSITVSCNLKNAGLLAELGTALDGATSAATAVSAGCFVESDTYTFTDDFLTHLFSTVR